MEFNFYICLIFILTNFLVILCSKNLIIYFNIYDYPNSERKFHKKKISLFGGSLIFINIILFVFLNLIFEEIEITDLDTISFFIGSILFYTLGLFDDKIDLNSNLKFILAFLIISFVIFIDKDLIINTIYLKSFNISISLGKFSFIFTALCVVIFINALNMYDGINLQSGLYCLIIIFSLFWFSSEYNLLVILSISIVSFLYLNFKSKIFLGDSGTYLLGYIISYLIIYFTKDTNYSILSADKIFVLMMLPGIELVRLFITRLILKRHPFSADRNHIHHILLKKIGYNKTIIFLNLLVIIPILCSLLLNNYENFIIVFFLLFYFTTIYIYGK